MNALLLKTINFLFPISCAQCGKILPYDDSLRICDICLSNIKKIEGLACRKCGKELPDGGEHCYACRKQSKYHFENVRSSCVYEGIAKDLVHKLKYGGRDYLAGIMGKLMTETLNSQEYRDKVDYVVPVPMHWVKEYLRGYNQAELLAMKIAESFGKPILKGFKRKRITKPQYDLKKEERCSNVSGCFALKQSAKAEVKDKTLLLIDDVCTTCSTIEECSKTLIRAGARSVYALTFAKD